VGYRFFERHEIRMGYMFDQAAALDENLAINDVDADKHMVGGGYGLELKRVNLAVAYSRIFFPERVVRGGKSKALSVVADSGVSNDGIYRWDVQLIGVNAGVRF
jgi:long-subunit fatty acid transport protein